MKLDLTQSNIDAFHFWLDIDLGDSSPVELLGDYANLLMRDIGIVYGETYSRRRTTHVVRASVYPPPEDNSLYHIHVSYDAKQRIPPPPENLGIERATTLFNQLSVLPGDFEFNATIRFDYPIEQHKSILLIPLQVNPLPETPFDEIQGMRVVKHLNDEIEYSISVDIRDNRLIHIVRFIHSSMISSEVGKTILDTGIKISNLFLA